MNAPSEERGCLRKANLGRNFKEQADKFARIYAKQFIVYQCPHCGGRHMTSKIDKAGYLYKTKIGAE